MTASRSETDPSFLTNFFRALRECLLGMRLLLGEPEVRRSYRMVILILALIVTAVNAAFVYGVFHFTKVEPNASLAFTGGMFLLRFLLLVVGALLVPVFALTSLHLLFPVFAEVPFFAGLRAFDVERAKDLLSHPGVPMHASLLRSLTRLARFFALSAACFAVGFLPLLGPLLAPCLQFFLSARTVGEELFDPFFDHLGLEASTRGERVREFRAESLAVGVVAVPVLCVPLLGPFAFGLLQASVARVVVFSRLSTLKGAADARA